MKFHEIKSDQWEALKPYLDTCLIPFGWLTGEESPDEVAQKLDQLRVKLDWLEIPFRGRVVTYPAFQYAFDPDKTQQMDQIRHVCERIRSQGFKFIVAVSFVDIPVAISAHFDLVIDTKIPSAGAVKNQLSSLWCGNVMNL